MDGDLEGASKFLSFVLRHNPAAIGAELDKGGWADIGALLDAARQHGQALSRGTLEQILAAPGKRRFETQDGRIRAAQGHSFPVDLGLAPLQPPELLYHGTVERFWAPIRDQGLQPRSRTHVHLSADLLAARTVGARRGTPVILEISALAMHQAGGTFYRAANGVWLTARVAPRWITRMAE